MRAGGGKSKGAAFEREVCTLLSKWLTNGKQDDVFWRSAMSGGRATVAAKKGKRLSNQVGDITCIDPIGHRFISAFGVECKFYADLDYQGLLVGKGKLLAFWLEIRKQAHAHNKMPFLVAKQNRMPVFVHLCSSGVVTLGLDNSVTVQTNLPHDLYTIEADYFFGNCVPYVDNSRRHSPDRQRKRRVPLRPV